MDGVGDRRCEARHGQLPDAFDSEDVDVLVTLLDEGDVDQRNVRVCGDEVFVEAGVEDARGLPISRGRFDERLPDAHDRPAAHLTGRGLFVEDAARRKCAGEPSHADESEVRVDSDDSEPRAVGEGRALSDGNAARDTGSSGEARGRVPLAHDVERHQLPSSDDLAERVCAAVAVDEPPPLAASNSGSAS